MAKKHLIRKKRPCRICGRWFLPDKHVGARQRVCSRAECQKKRHRLESSDYRRRERGKAREVRIVSSIRRDGIAETEVPPEGSPLALLDWRMVRELVGLEQAVIIQEAGRVVLSGVRELVRLEVGAFIGKAPKVVRHGRREQLPGKGDLSYPGVAGEGDHADRAASTGSEVRESEGPQPP